MNNYKKKIQVKKTTDGEVIITMPEGIHTRLMNNLFDGYLRQQDRELKSLAKDTLELWEAIDTDN